jgi:hypothetical protein
VPESILRNSAPSVQYMGQYEKSLDESREAMRLEPNSVNFTSVTRPTLRSVRAMRQHASSRKFLIIPAASLTALRVRWRTWAWAALMPSRLV